jgi:hypothetical protein
MHCRRLEEQSRFCVLLVCALLLAAVPTRAVAQANSWIKPSSGSWEEQSSWALGVLPDQSQSVYITNAGWKAVAIGANTSQNFPQSLQIQDFHIASPTDSFNVFLMNFSGFEVPLQTTSLSVASNSSVIVQSSRLDAGNVNLYGTFSQGDFSQVKVNGQLQMGTFGGGGAYYLTNGTLSVKDMYMGGFGPTATLIQYGGANNVGHLSINIQAEYDLYDGQLNATNGLAVGSGDYANGASFYQYGGSVNADTIVNGHYTLNGGTITGAMAMGYDPSVGGQQRVDAFFLQNGGTNFAASMDLGHPNRFGGRAFYTLSNGVVQVASSVAFNGSQFSQYNGQVTIVSNLVVHNTEGGLDVNDAHYLLAGGTLSAGALTAQSATFDQTGGSNFIAGDIDLVGVPTPPRPGVGPVTVSYTLSGGLLSSRNLTVTAGYYSGFGQAGGSNQIAEKLTLQGASPGAFEYTLQGGTLSVKNIYIADGAFFQHTNGAIIHSGLLTLSQGEWRAAAAAQSLGPLQITIGSSNNNSAITFPNGTSALRLANSSAQPWDSSAILYVTNWHGSASGGGTTQLYFGSSSSGLTSRQLSQIRFALPTGGAAAKILTTGEVVPAGATFDFTRNAGTLNLTWPSGWFLQSATNLAGPYNDVPGTSSPYPVDMTSPQQFFRIRQ